MLCQTNDSGFHVCDEVASSGRVAELGILDIA
jgi:hypothetical protein